MVEFAINSSVNATTGYAPFELNHGYIPRLEQHISTNTFFRGVKQFAQPLWNLLDAHDTVLKHRVAQTHHSNKHQRPSVQYQPNDLVHILVNKNLTLPKGRVRKLIPRFIGPYKVLRLINDS